LDQYAKIEEVPGLCNDEVRTPLFAQAFNMPVYDTGLGNKYFTAGGEKIFTPSVVYREYAKGIKSFHPVEKPINLNKILKIKKQIK
ncbi:MAG: hypothetical protein Q8L57_02970, partial [bacterium]|nr:hypothetical protein [bacterium]